MHRATNKFDSLRCFVVLCRAVKPDFPEVPVILELLPSQSGRVRFPARRPYLSRSHESIHVRIVFTSGVGACCAERFTFDMMVCFGTLRITLESVRTERIDAFLHFCVSHEVVSHSVLLKFRVGTSRDCRCFAHHSVHSMNESSCHNRMPTSYMYIKVRAV